MRAWKRITPCLLSTLFLLQLGTGAAFAQLATSAKNLPLPHDQWTANKIIPPELIHGEKVEYPGDARFQQIDGLCSVSAVVNSQGEPQDIRIIHCTNSSFEESSLDAAKQCRFKPATTDEGKPVPVKVSFLYRYHWAKYSLSLHLLINWPIVPDKRLNIDRHLSKADINREMSVPIHYGFIPQQGGIPVPDSDGIYPFTRSVTGPRVIKFSDEGYGPLAFSHEGDSACDVVLTIDVRGRASDPQGTHCEWKESEKPAVESLLKSNYKPGLIHGKEVPMRALIHLNYGDAQGTLPIPPQ